ncbi:hypothetical protein [Streptomyces sp. NPDC056069]|uniref:hypothetical protein n=1 Tax=Streptomyces sp. NPDC056069 TaxID=3345702 RepID=UPI0035D9E0FE
MAADGAWEEVFAALAAQARAESDLDWLVVVDSTSVWAYQHTADARQGAPAGGSADHASVTVPRRDTSGR